MSNFIRTALPYSVSQNFLTSRRTIKRLVALTSLSEDDLVLEIGAGKGHITRVLAGHCGRVIAYEIDPALARRLQPELPENVRVYQADFLKAALPKTPYKVFANIPFSRTTDIVRRLVCAKLPPEAMWLVMEKGAAKRFCGLPRENRSSLTLRPYYDTRIIYHFSRNDFHPAPRVDCVLLEFIRKAPPDIAPALRQTFAGFLEKAAQNGIYSLITRKQAATALHLAGLPPLAPSGCTLYIQWLCLFQCWLKFGKHQ